MLTKLSTGECLLPIGCSCIIQFQIEFFAVSAPTDYQVSGSPFRWNITTPEATAHLLNAVCENRNYSLLDSPEDIVWDATWPCSGKIPGLYFWHIAKEVGAANRMEARTLLQDAAVFARFKSKYDHLLAGLSELPRDTVFVWSNIQPNLKAAIEMVEQVAWDDFILTDERMMDIKRALRALGFNDPACVWICRQEDCAISVPPPDVHLMPLERSDEYKGEVGLFDEIYRRCLSARVEK